MTFKPNAVDLLGGEDVDCSDTGGASSSGSHFTRLAKRDEEVCGAADGNGDAGKVDAASEQETTMQTQQAGRQGNMPKWGRPVFLLGPVRRLSSEHRHNSRKVMAENIIPSAKWLLERAVRSAMYEPIFAIKSHIYCPCI